MTSGVGAPEQRTGELRVRAQGTAGERPLRIGSAWPVIGWACIALAILCVIAVWATGKANGVLVLATGFAALGFWAFGVFSRDFWVTDDPAYAQTDRELDELAGN